MVQTELSADVLIVGAGPAGLSAAIQTSSVGLKTIICDKSRPGGQSADNKSIKNYPGFAKEITNIELATRMVEQATNLGADFRSCRIEALNYSTSEECWYAKSDEEMKFTAKYVMLATGFTFHKLNSKNATIYEDKGVYYGSAYITTDVRDTNVCVVGKADSAGYAALQLADDVTRNVTMLVRESSFQDKMPQYLIKRIEESSNIEVRFNTEIEEISGPFNGVKIVVTRNSETGVTEKMQFGSIFAFSEANHIQNGYKT